MADTKISALSAVTTPALTDEFAVNQSAASKKETMAQIVQMGYSSVFNAVRYGLSTGGTGTANSTALHAARDAAGTNGIVYIPPGTYTVNKVQLNVAGQTWYLAAGCVLSYATTQNSDLLEIGATDVTVEGGNWTTILDHNSSLQSSGSGIYITGANRATVKNLKVMDVKSRGINVTNSDEVMIDRVWVDSTGSDGIFFEGNSGTEDCTVMNSKVTGGPSSGDADCVSAHGNAASGTIHGFRAINNYLSPNGTGQFGIEVGAFSGTDPQERVIISNNVIECAAASFGGISLDGCEGAVVANNSFDDMGNVCTIAAVELASSEECTITGNRMTTSKTKHPISVDRSNRNMVTGNIIHGWDYTNSGVGIHVTSSQASQTCNDNVISDNILIADASNSTEGIWMQANASSVTIDRNTISNNSFVGTGSAKAIKLEINTGTMNLNRITGNNFFNWGTTATIDPTTATNTIFDQPGATVTSRLAATHTIASATGTEVTLGATGVDPGTYTFLYSLLFQSSSTTVGPQFGVNFTGTATGAFTMRYGGTGTTANTGIADDQAAALTGQLMEASPNRAFSTTAGNMSFTGVATINQNILVEIAGVLVVTARGDIELWHGSDTTTNTSVMAGSSFSLQRTA